MNTQVIEKYRLKKNLTHAELSESLGRESSWYSTIAHGKRLLPIRYIEPLAQVFGISPERFARELFSDKKVE